MISPRQLPSFARAAAVALALAQVAGCASRAHRADAPPAAANGPGAALPAQAEVQGPPEPFGPPAPPAAMPFGPDAPKPTGVVLVLGPGMGRAFAHAGVIRALAEAKINVTAVLGTEMGALIGALYAVDGNLNHFEWRLVKLKPEIFSANGGAILSKVFRERGSGERLEHELRKLLAAKEIQASKLPLRIALADARSARVEVLDRGDLVDAIRGAVAVPGYFKPVRVEGGDRVSAGPTRPFLVREARGLGLGPVIVVDGGGGGASAAALSRPAAEELKDADLVIRPALDAIGVDDFSKRSEAAFQGKQAVNARLPEIRKLLGEK